MDIPIIFEDDLLLVIDKPCGISVVEDEVSEVSKNGVLRETIREWVRKRYNYRYLQKGKEDDFEHRFGIVHRLDKETSGVLLIAKSKMVFDHLKGLFKYRRVHKKYQVLTYGVILDDQFEVSAPVGRDKNLKTAYSVEEEGREATTDFMVLERYEGGAIKSETSGLIFNSPATYLEAYPKTGRTHQIRVHLKALGHPVVNDYKYAPKKCLNLSEGTFDRMMLHSKTLGFIDWNNKNRQFSSPKNLSDLFTKVSSQK